MARGRRDPELRSSPDTQERQSRQRRVSAQWDNTLHLNISHQPTLIYSGSEESDLQAFLAQLGEKAPARADQILGEIIQVTLWVIQGIVKDLSGLGLLQLLEEVIDLEVGLGGPIRQTEDQLQ